ncbi:hypothetical protein [Sphingomonas sp. Leaf357]|uniref:hypothetical protein n=1 Tax=Sphingomonas sp. Leaf357 TaxID=1736350 RepID=UPI0012E18063|nr:hypothetical protein [Sphingomonas sp. Leaf357]
MMSFSPINSGAVIVAKAGISGEGAGREPLETSAGLNMPCMFKDGPGDHPTPHSSAGVTMMVGGRHHFARQRKQEDLLARRREGAKMLSSASSAALHEPVLFFARRGAEDAAIKELLFASSRLRASKSSSLPASSLRAFVSSCEKNLLARSHEATKKEMANG